jgi:hypothetical protein
MRFSAPLALAAGWLAVTASIALGSPLAAIAQAPENPFADVPPAAVIAQGRTIQTAFVGGTWDTPPGLAFASTPAPIHLGARQTLRVRSRAWFDIVLREPVASVRAFPTVDTTNGQLPAPRLGAVSFLRVLPDAHDPLRWHVRAPHLPRGAPAQATGIEATYTRGVIHYRFLMAPKRPSS